MNVIPIAPYRLKLNVVPLRNPFRRLYNNPYYLLIQ